MKSLHKGNQNSFPPKIQVHEYLALINTTVSTQQKSAALREIIKICYSNKANQFYLCNNLNLPFNEGPISLTTVPIGWSGKEGQLLSLFTYLKKVKQSYACWVIFEDADLRILNLKLITRFELDELSTEFQFDQSLVGIFIGSKYFSKSRALSTKIGAQSFGFCSKGLSSKTTKQSLIEKCNKSNKNLKSISMKQKKTLKHDFSNKTIGDLAINNQRSNVNQVKQHQSTFSKTNSETNFKNARKNTKLVKVKKSECF